MNILDYKKNALPEVPSWDDLIKILDNKFNNPHPEFKHEPEDLFVFNGESCTDISMHYKLDITCWNVANNRTKTLAIPEIAKLVEMFKDKIDYEWTTKALINLVGKEAALSAHKDDHDVVSWQCKGRVEYRIYEDVECEYGVPIDFRGLKYDSYILNPGDVIYMPMGTIHQAVVFEPRATLILDFPVK